MYALVNNGKASMWELKNVFTLDEALKLYALLDMELDVEAAKAAEMKEDARRGR